jgi:glycosyltransferase involved in cell wall biosynthesis
MMKDPRLTVVVATTATRERASTLLRAVATIRDQDIRCRIVVVANGRKRDNDLVSALKQDDIDVLELEEGNLVNALVAGVEAVATEYFCVLDDDDILMPGSCRKRVRYMDAHPETDALVTPGEKSWSDGRIERIPAYFDAHDPLLSLLKCNWLASCGGVYRRSRIGPEYFGSMPRYLEWTYFAFRLVRERSVHFWMDDPDPHFRIFETAGSESQTLDYIFAMPVSLARMRDRSLPARTQRLLTEKIARALHDAVTHCMAQSRTKEAWSFHLRSLCHLYGLRYVPFTRRLIVETLRSAITKPSR